MWLLALAVGGAKLMALEISGEEATLYAQAEGEKDPARRVQLLETYLMTYPSGYYKTTVNYLATLTFAQLNQSSKVIQYGEETLRADPDSIDILLALANVYSVRPETHQKSIGYSEHALVVIDKKAGQQPPKGVSADTWKSECEKLEKRALYVNSFVKGLVAIERKDCAGAVEPLKTAYSIARNPAIAYFLGICYSKTGKSVEAISILCEAVALNGAKKEQAQKELERIYQEKNKTLEGLQQKIEEARTRIR